jgi:hypothetical protein
VGGAGWGARREAPTRQAGPPPVAGIAALGPPPVRALAGAPGLPWAPDGHGVEGLCEAPARRRGGRLQVGSPRRTRAIDQSQPLRTRAAFRLADLGAPVVAGAKRPAAQQASQRRCCWAGRGATKARHRLRSPPGASHSWRRRQQVLALPYRRGSARPCAPVHRGPRRPAPHRRASTRGRPPRVAACGGGRGARIASPGGVVSPRHAMACLRRWLGGSWRSDTPTRRF